MRRRRKIGAILIAVLVAATGVTLALPGVAFAASSCTASSLFKLVNDPPGSLTIGAAEVPTIGNETHQANCDLSVGNDNSGVMALQQSLNWCYHQYGVNIANDGIFGSQTQAALRIAQQHSGVTVDGIYGPQTRNAMLWGDAGDGAPCRKLVQPLAPD
jgi:hypothetical protein